MNNIVINNDALEFITIILLLYYYYYYRLN